MPRSIDLGLPSYSIEKCRELLSLDPASCKRLFLIAHGEKVRHAHNRRAKKSGKQRAAKGGAA